MLLAVEAAVVVGHRVEVEVLDQPVQPDRDLRAPGEVVVVDRVVEGEDLPGQLHALRDLGVGDLVDPHPQVVELEHLDVRAERRGDRVRSVETSSMPG